MEMTDSAFYSTEELPAGPQAQNDYRLHQKVALSKSSLPCLGTVFLGLLTVTLMSLLVYQWILCQGSTCASCPTCPNFWMRYNSHCYYFSVEKKDWNSSLEFCTNKDSHLLMITDNQEMYLLQDVLNENFYWIGLRNHYGWRWEDGSALNSSRIISNSLVQKCGAINQDSLQASSCEVPLQWICKKTRH